MESKLDNWLLLSNDLTVQSNAQSHEDLPGSEQTDSNSIIIDIPNLYEETQKELSETKSENIKLREAINILNAEKLRDNIFHDVLKKRLMVISIMMVLYTLGLAMLIFLC